MPETSVNSFVIRFVQEQSLNPGMDERIPWRGTIRHVQSSQEKRFTCMDDALNFMDGFLELNPENRPKGSSPLE